MLKLREDTRIYVADKAVDCRKAINGLAALVIEQFENPVNDGSVYVFYNSSCDRVSVCFGIRMALFFYHKRLERGRFKMSKTATGAYVISQNQLDWLLAGLDFQLMNEFNTLNFSHYF